MRRTLFIAGCGRSGTTALATYLNDHPSVCVTVERYKLVPERVRPELFAFSRILDLRPEETNHQVERYEKLLASKSEAELRWVGDKSPSYFRHLDALARNNPGASLLFTYRPIEAVAGSYAARARNPDDPWLGGRDAVALAKRDWNAANRALSGFAPTRPDVPLWLVDYDHFFADPARSAEEMSAFLDVDFGDVARRWGRRNERFARRRRDKQLSEDETADIRRSVDRRAEAWMLERLATQGQRSATK